MKTLKKHVATYVIAMLAIYTPYLTHAQTEQDALMMGEDNLCIAAVYNYNSWTDYWEGTFKRDNLNIGRLSTTSGMVMLNYGISKNLNIMAGVPYVSTRAGNGTLAGLKGFQDVNFFVKYRAIKTEFRKQRISVFAVGGFSTPSSNYNIDFLPMSIGLGSDVTTGRLIADYQSGKIFATVSGSYMYRSNVKIDRPAYYTTRQINSHEVEMPNSGNYQIRTGYRNKGLSAEAFVNYMKTFGGFDIRKNDMPFVSNEMTSTNVGLEGKYYFNKIPELGFQGGAWYTLQGRNVGQATGFMFGVFYTVKSAFKSNR